MNTIETDLSRRTFIRTLSAAAGGLVLGFHIPGAKANIIAAKPWTTPTEGAPEVNAWLTIDTAGTVTIRVPHTEQGQGALTSVASMIAEELDVPWKNVRAVFADMNRQVNRGKEYKVTSTAGSALVRTQHPHIMQAGASARERLKQAAAEAWGVNRSQVTAKQGVLTAGSKTGTYAEFATAAGKVTLSEEPKIKAYGPANWWLLGKDLPRLDVAVKVNGSATFSIDIELDGMVYAAVKQTPVPFGKLVKYDASAIKGRPGILGVVEFRAVPGKRGPNDLQDAIAVVADSWYRAKVAVDLIPVEWDFGGLDKVSDATQAADARRLWDVPGVISKEQGPDARPLIAAASRVVRAEYSRPFETHARMEPINATVHVKEKTIDVWSPTQDQTTPIDIVADQLKRDTKDIYAHPMFLGGAFGGNGGGNTAVTRQAAIISEQFKRPAKVIWTREEDFNHDKQRPPHYTRLAAALGTDGLPTAFVSNAVWYPFEAANTVGPASADVTISNMPYVIPSRRHEKHNQNGHIPTATHRGPGVNQNAFIMEQFADEMALAGGWDPLDWRIKLTEGQERWQRVLLKMKDVAGFKTKLPQGQGMGVAIAEDHGSICGTCATVSVGRRGDLTIEKIVIVQNSGYVINPRAAAEQLKGAAIYELSHAVYGGLKLEGGRFVNTNFDSYKLMRIDQVPEFEVHFALSQDGWWGGMGEPGGVSAPASVANAIFFATGRRIRSTPIIKSDLTPLTSGRA